VITPDFDLVVNWCVSSTDSLYAQYKKDSTRFLLGFENTILLDYFDLANIQKRSHSDKIQKILVTMGGVDEFDLTARVVKGLSLIDEEWEVRIILGPGYSRKAELLKIIDLGKSNFSLKENIDNLYADYLWADLAFSAGGLSSSELVATKTPAILVAAYEHQVARCQYFHQQQWAYYTGRENLFDTQTVKNSLDYLQKNIGDMRNNLQKNEFRGGNEKIFAHISSYRQSAKLVS
jgi:spore coat polysaccharide biosynthesis predicted glycosyltransferase SpsG